MAPIPAITMARFPSLWERIEVRCSIGKIVVHTLKSRPASDGCAPCGRAMTWRLLAAALAMSALTVPALAEALGAQVRRFVFDGAFTAAPGLEFQFSRPAATVGPAGEVVASHTPRYGRERLLASGPSVVESIRATPWMTRLLASGLDHDGQTPLLVLREYVEEVLDIFTVGSEAMLAAEATGVGRIRTRLTGPWSARADILQGQVAGKTYNPEAGVVCHGLIVLLCAVTSETSPGVWQPIATAVVISIDQGLTWSLHSEDAPVQPGAARVRSWSMQNWWPLTRGGLPTEAWFAAADYRYRGPGVADANGGRTLLFRATRAVVGAPWSLEPAAPVITSANGLGEHAHSAAVTPFGASGLRVITAFGDGFEFSRIASATRADMAYQAPGWSVNQAYHGSLETSGFQFVGCAPGPEPGEILLGADEGAQQIFLLRPDDDPQSRAALQHVHGEGFQSGPGTRVFLIRTPTPESGGPYIASLSAGLEAHPGRSERTLYSPDGRLWAEAFAPGAAHEPVLHDGDIYLDSLTAAAGVRRIKAPSTRRLSPLLIGRGGENLLASTQTAPAPGDTQNILRLLTLPERALLDPQPPTSGPVYEVRATPAGGWLVARWRLMNGHGQLPAGRFTVRAWAMPIGAESVDMLLRLGDGVTWTPERSQHAVIANDSWSPISLRDTHTPTSGSPYEPELLLTKPPGVQYGSYIAFDSLTHGSGFPGFALPVAGTSSSEVGIITGLLASPTWTIALAGEVPDDAWDASTSTPTKWTLACVRADQANFIELVADTSTRKLLIRVTSAGSPGPTIEIPDAFFMRASQVRVCISGSPSRTDVTATVGMRPLFSSSAPMGLAAPPREIRLSSADQTSVASFAWFGGMVDPLNAYDLAQREALLRSLAFLEPIAITPGDVNGDGRVDHADLSQVLASFGRSGPGTPGDANGDGFVDFLDLNSVLSAFGAAR